MIEGKTYRITAPAAGWRFVWREEIPEQDPVVLAEWFAPGPGEWHVRIEPRPKGCPEGLYVITAKRPDGSL